MALNKLACSVNLQKIHISYQATEHFSPLSIQYKCSKKFALRNGILVLLFFLTAA